MQEGCDKFCTYCVVPYTRGAEISRPWGDIVAEAQALVDAGAREIVLLGQNVNAWSDGERGLAELIRALARIDGLERIRYTTSHPADMNDALIAAHGEVEKLMPYLHLPVQSGSDRILKAMNRSHTAETYLRTIGEDARRPPRHRACPATSSSASRARPRRISRRRCSIVDAVGYASAYSFKYSARPGTPAATMEDQIPREVMDERLQRLQDRINEHQPRVQPVESGQRHADPDRAQGPARRPDDRQARPWLQSVHVETDAQPGDMLDVTLVAAGPNSLAGAVRQKVAA